MLVAVRLPPAVGRIGDYVADVTALEAAGAHAVWLDASAKVPAEPWLLLGAIAAVTYRIRLGVDVASASGWAAASEALERLSGGRVVIAMRPGRSRSAPRQAPILVSCRTRGDARRSAPRADGLILPGSHEEVIALRSELSLEPGFELWSEASIPADRAGWVDMVAAFDAAGATGVIVPWDPRLIDLLRGAGEPDDRADLLIATG